MSTKLGAAMVTGLMLVSAAGCTLGDPQDSRRPLIARAESTEVCPDMGIGGDTTGTAYPASSLCPEDHHVGDSCLSDADCCARSCGAALACDPTIGWKCAVAAPSTFTFTCGKQTCSCPRTENNGDPPNGSSVVECYDCSGEFTPADGGAAITTQICIYDCGYVVQATCK
jgi:hypothetical protein